MKESFQVAGHPSASFVKAFCPSPIHKATPHLHAAVTSKHAPLVLFTQEQMLCQSPGTEAELAPEMVLPRCLFTAVAAMARWAAAAAARLGRAAVAIARSTSGVSSVTWGVTSFWAAAAAARLGLAAVPTGRSNVGVSSTTWGVASFPSSFWAYKLTSLILPDFPLCIVQFS